MTLVLFTTVLWKLILTVSAIGCVAWALEDEYLEKFGKDHLKVVGNIATAFVAVSGFSLLLVKIWSA